MKHAFISRKFTPSACVMIETINSIIEEYRQQGFTLSLRQLYYQLVARDYIENTVRSYHNVGNLVSNARQAGLIDWDMIEDRGRETVTPSHWNSPGQIIDVAANQFRIDKWQDQPAHVQVMVEKDALSGVLEPVCRDLDISITANKGYSSSSTMYEIGQRLSRLHSGGKAITIIYLGDHDPSGIDMTRDVSERLTMYSELSASQIEVVRVALNYSQVEEWQPPENPAKQTDTRFAAYAEQFGKSSWELDAVEPARLASLVRDIVAARRDDTLWQRAVERETKMRDDLKAFAASYSDSE